jgi:hypothetical protein
MLKVCVFACILGSVLAAHVQPASADGWPSNVVGSWSVLGDQTRGILNISTQNTSGLCQFIGGTIYGDPIQGFYCPNSGRIQFVRKIASNNDTVQVWTGNLSRGSSTLHMAGTVTSVDPNGGSPGEYNFNADK